jgi:hypothetical protein
MFCFIVEYIFEMGDFYVNFMIRAYSTTNKNNHNVFNCVIYL